MTRNTDEQETRNTAGYKAAAFDFHKFSAGLTRHLTACLAPSIISSPELLFRIELFIFPEKVRDLINRLTLDLPVANPGGPLGRAVSALSELERLIDEAREHIAADDVQAANEKIRQADELANDEDIFPPQGPPPDPAAPVHWTDLQSIRAELGFLKRYAAMLAELDED